MLTLHAVAEADVDDVPLVMRCPRPQDGAQLSLKGGHLRRPKLFKIEFGLPGLDVVSMNVEVCLATDLVLFPGNLEKLIDPKGMRGTKNRLLVDLSTGI